MVDCVSCGLPSGYHRVLVERGSGTEVGGLCVECEEHELGDRLNWEIRAETEPEACALCAGDARVHVPEWDPKLEPSADGTTEWTEYRVTGSTPGLCADHVEAIVDAGSEDASLRTAPRSSD